MSYPQTQYQPYDFEHRIAATADAAARTTFIRQTYLHLAGAVGAFVILSAAIVLLVPDSVKVSVLQALGATPWMWLVVLGAFMGVSWLANAWAHGATSRGMQYAGLGLYVAAEALIFSPLLFIAHAYYPGSLPTAAIITLVVFGGLTAFVFITKADASWMGKWLAIGGLAAMAFIVCSIFFSFNVGLLFSFLMVALASGYIVYYTSNILHHYRTDQYVAASLALFASVALLFWYVLRIVIALSGRD
jgi:FtsH-binding integral membrane protein